jgi:predicted ATP-grasp superfamily ATP-dependent carboligase
MIDGPPPATTDDSLSPALLADATWYGTLAAVRDLGVHGVPITLATDTLLAPASWSRYVTRTVRCPPTKDTDRFLAWLHEFGDRHPGHVLYPTSDELAWILACHRDELSKKFRMYSPSAQTLSSLLDKGRLLTAGRGAGLPVPQTWLPESEDEVARIAREAPFPVFVKPRTQLQATRGLKGDRVDRCQDLLPIWRALRMPREQQERLGSAMTGVGLPLIQACHAGNEQIYTVDGFISREGAMITLGCNKLLQHPRRRGPGIVFEEAQVPASIVAGLQRLWRQTGFYGVFDIEFVIDGDHAMLIDLNPRLYNHMAFEIERGLPLPWFAYLAACGEDELLAHALQAARWHPSLRPTVYVHRLPTAMMVALQGARGSMSPSECRYWLKRIAGRCGRVTDPSLMVGDRLPAIMDVVVHAARLLRHPRSFLGQLALNDFVPLASTERPAPVHAPVAETLTARSQ